MTTEEFKFEKRKLDKEYKKSIKELINFFIKKKDSNEKIRDGKGTIIIESINIDENNNCVFSGMAINRNGKPYKQNRTRQIKDKDIIND